MHILRESYIDQLKIINGIEWAKWTLFTSPPRSTTLNVVSGFVKRLDFTTTIYEEENINKDVVSVEGPTKRKRQEEKRLRDAQV